MKTLNTPTLSYGLLAWFFSVQYYVVQLVVASDWSQANAYSLSQNTISDLGNTVCGPYGQRIVCSPLHSYMNMSFILLGLSMIIGSLLLGKYSTPSRRNYAGFSAMAIAGVGTILVGLFPENTVSAMHILGAALPFVFGNLAMIILGLGITGMPGWLKTYTLASGVIGLLALVLFMLHLYLGIDIGGMERVVAYPQSIWMTVFGAYFLIVQRKNISETIFR